MAMATTLDNAVAGCTLSSSHLLTYVFLKTALYSIYSNYPPITDNET